MSNLAKYSRMFMQRSGVYMLTIAFIAVPVYRKMESSNTQSLSGCRNKTELFGGKQLKEGEVLWK